MTYLNNRPDDICDVSPGAFIPPLAEDAALELAVDSLTLSLAPFAPAILPSDMPYESSAAEIEDEPETDNATTPAFPRLPGILDTRRLRALLPIFISQLFSMFSVETVQRGAVARLWEIRKALWALYKTEKQNYITALTHSLQSQPEWQAQVREDLGGEDALKRWDRRWERRQRLMQETKSEAPDSANKAITKTAAKPRPKPKPRKVLTDRTGLFRLASLAQPKTRPVKQANVRFALRQVPLFFAAPKAIGLTPDQLRTKITATASLSRAALCDIWDTLQNQHRQHNDNIVIADLMTTLRAFREDYAPP